MAVVIGIIIAIINGWSQGMTIYSIIVAISIAACSIIAHPLRLKYGKVAKEVCCPLERASIQWKLDKAGLGWIEFGNRAYAEAFAKVNNLTLPSGGEAEGKAAAAT